MCKICPGHLKINCDQTLETKFIKKTLHITSLNVKRKRDAYDSALLLLQWKLETLQREKVTGEKVAESACRLRLFDESITPNFLAETGIHQSASNASSTAKMKESLEAVAEGRKTHVRTLLNECTHARATVRKTEKRRRYRDVCVCVCVCPCPLLLAGSEWIN